MNTSQLFFHFRIESIPLFAPVVHEADLIPILDPGLPVAKSSWKKEKFKTDHRGSAKQTQYSGKKTVASPKWRGGRRIPKTHADLPHPAALPTTPTIIGRMFNFQNSQFSAKSVWFQGSPAMEKYCYLFFLKKQVMINSHVHGR